MISIFKFILFAAAFLLPKIATENSVIVGYYTDWSSNFLTPEQIPYSKLTHINYGMGDRESFSFNLLINLREYY